MRQPFKVGDIVQSKIARHRQTAIVTRAHKKDGHFYLDVYWFHTGKEVKWYTDRQFNLISGAE